jgi:hypothetical protein
MKKIFVIIMTICLLAGALCVTAFAADEPASGVVMTVSGLTNDGPVKIEDYTSFEAGWNFAMEKAEDKKYLDDNQYDRIVVDLSADWKATEKGVFGDSDGVGFREDTIYIPEKARVMLNMNGHTINRGLGDRNQFDGEVIHIDEKADVIINGGKSGDAIARADDTNAVFGTITGGNNDGGAGGIHIQDDAKVTLNNVKIVNNVADGDYGAGIAVYDGANFIMNGGGFVGNENNSYRFDPLGFYVFGGGIYIEDSTASFDNVLFDGNQFTYDSGSGAALYAYDSSVTLNKCKLIGNGKKNEADGTVGAESIIGVNGGNMLIIETDFIGNGTLIDRHDGTANSAIKMNNFFGTAPRLSIDKCTFTQNNVGHIFNISGKNIMVANSRFTDNRSNVLYCSTSDEAIFTDCAFNNNNCATVGGNYTFNVVSGHKALTFIDCDMGNSTYNDRNCVQIENSGTGSIFGEGSLALIVAILSLIASGVSIFFVVFYNKKKAAPVAANGAAETENDEE